VRLMDGRTFVDRETLGTDGVAMVNQAFADRILDGRALGRTIRSGSARASTGYTTVPGEFRIVGIVANERFRGLEQPSEPAVYLSTRQFPQLTLSMLLRTAVDPRSLAQPARDIVRRFDPGVPVATMTTLSEILAEQMVTRRSTTRVIDGFAGGSLALAALGLYGLLTLLVASRTRETGIRLALGSSPTAEALRVVRECVANAGAGVVVGLVLALPCGRLVRSLLVGVSAYDPPTLIAVAAAMLVVGLAAAVLPAWRTSRVDPCVALRG
jgi:putative ABC transport system permease protein